MRKEVRIEKPKSGLSNSSRTNEQVYCQIEEIARKFDQDVFGNLYQDVLGELYIFVCNTPELLNDRQELLNKKLLNKALSVKWADVREHQRHSRPYHWKKLTPHQFPVVVVDDGEVIPVDHRSDKGTTLEVPKIDYEWLPELCELTQRELQVLDTIVRLTTGWGRDLSAKEVAQGMKELWNVKLNADAVRHHFAKIREKAQVLRWMHWRRLLNSPSTESAERYIASLGPNPRCPVRLAATAWVLGISLGPAIKRAEVDFAYDCALRAWKRTKDLNLERHNMHAHYLSNGILAYTEILRAYVGSPNCNWENALKVCREEIQRTARTWSSLGFEHAYFLGRVARDLKLYGVAEGIQQSRPMVANPSGFTAFLEQYYPCPDLASALKRLLPRITMKPDPKCPFVGR